jgi:HK97 gp10 family phage protein
MSKIVQKEIKLDLITPANDVQMQTASECSRQVQQMAPKRTGKYAGQIDYQKNGTAWVVCNTGSTAPLGHLLEFGTLYAKARPHYRPAFNIYKDIYIERMRNLDVELT